MPSRSEEYEVVLSAVEAVYDAHESTYAAANSIHQLQYKASESLETALSASDIDDTQIESIFASHLLLHDQRGAEAERSANDFAALLLANLEALKARSLRTDGMIDVQREVMRFITAESNTAVWLVDTQQKYFAESDLSLVLTAQGDDDGSFNAFMSSQNQMSMMQRTRYDRITSRERVCQTLTLALPDVLGFEDRLADVCKYRFE